MSRVNQGSETPASQQLADKATQVRDNIRDIGSVAKDAAREQVQGLRDQANEYYEQGRQRVTEVEDSIETYVKEQPIKALLIAAGAGLLLGILWKRS